VTEKDSFQFELLKMEEMKNKDTSIKALVFTASVRPIVCDASLKSSTSQWSEVMSSSHGLLTYRNRSLSSSAQAPPPLLPAGLVLVAGQPCRCCLAPLHQAEWYWFRRSPPRTPLSPQPRQPSSSHSLLRPQVIAPPAPPFPCSRTPVGLRHSWCSPTWPKVLCVQATTSIK
jgi:hypothetical protein